MCQSFLSRVDRERNSDLPSNEVRHLAIQWLACSLGKHICDSDPGVLALRCCEIACDRGQTRGNNRLWGYRYKGRINIPNMVRTESVVARNNAIAALQLW